MAPSWLGKALGHNYPQILSPKANIEFLVKKVTSNHVCIIMTVHGVPFRVSRLCKGLIKVVHPCHTQVYAL